MKKKIETESERDAVSAIFIAINIWHPPQRFLFQCVCVFAHTYILMLSVDCPT